MWYQESICPLRVTLIGVLNPSNFHGCRTYDNENYKKVLGAEKTILYSICTILLPFESTDTRDSKVYYLIT